MPRNRRPAPPRRCPAAPPHPVLLRRRRPARDRTALRPRLAGATLGRRNDWQEQLLAAHATIGNDATLGTSNFRAKSVQLHTWPDVSRRSAIEVGHVVARPAVQA